MPPQFGTQIVDWQGALHDVTKQAFDAIAIKNKDHVQAGKRVFQDTLQSYVDKIGIKVDFSEPGAVDKLVREAASKIAAAYAGKMVAAAAATLAEWEIAAAVTGPIGIVIGLGVDFAINAFLADSTEKGYQPGQWVMLDNGSMTVSKQIERTVAWGETEMFGDAPWSEDQELDRQEDYSIGFVMGPNTEQFFWQCFNFKTNEVDRFHKDKIRPCSPEVAQQLDENEELSLVREYKFLKDAPAFMEGPVPTKPGSQVLLQGKEYTIVSTTGDWAIIQDKSGKQLSVVLSHLQRGKVTQTTTYNHPKEGATPPTAGFVTTPQGRIFRGQWLWLPPSIDQRLAYDDIPRSLGVVSIIDGKQVKGCYAIDGTKFSVLESDVEGLDPTTLQIVQALTNFQEFKSKVLEPGSNKAILQNHNPGTTFKLLCMGLGQSPGQSLLQHTKGKYFDQYQAYLKPTEGGEPEYVQDIGNDDAIRRSDKQEELVQKGHINVSTKGIAFPERNEGGNYMILFAVAAVGLFIFAT